MPGLPSDPNLVRRLRFALRLSWNLTKIDPFAAVERWPRDGIPQNPRAWLVSTGRFTAIDTMRRRARYDASLADLADRLDAAAAANPDADEESVEDDRLRLAFT